MHEANRRALRLRRAFTLLEVLMVLVILGLLAGLVVYNLAGVGDKAKVDATQANIGLIEGAIDLFRAQVGRYPNTLQELTEKPEDEKEAKSWGGPYIKDAEKLKDAWGRDLQYKVPGDYNKETYDLSSSGKDGQEGNDDDITNWTRT